MSKKQFRSQASSGRVGGGIGAFGSSGFASTQSSPLSYIQEPPDYSGISDANAVVAFKNLSKKDSTTKAKALEDIQAYISSLHAEVEDSLLEAWVKIYPRLSIDSARRVRQLSHSLSGQLWSKCGKRTVKHLPRIAGPWLAGGYDSDRAAAKAAQESLALVFPTADKVTALRKTFHGSLLEYCKDAVLYETVQTLSDERTVTPDDAQGTYARVVATSSAVITSLLSELSSGELSKQHHSYEELFASTKLWEFVNHTDAAVRRSLHRLVQTALSKQPDLIESHLGAISNAYINKGLPSDQTGSAADFVNTLDALSASFPTIWTDDYSSKKSAVSRLKQFLKHGSRSGSSDFWERTSRLFAKIPSAVLPTTFEEAKDLLCAARDGVTRKEERFSASVAWPAYFTLVAAISAGMQDGDREKLLDSCVMPIIRQYLQPSPVNADWAITGAKAALLVARAAGVSQTVALLEREWPQLADQLVETARVSQPQQSKDFDRSQMHVASTGERFATLQRELFATSPPESLRKVLVSSSTTTVRECAKLLETREGKPFGAAAIIEELLRTCAPHLMADLDFRAAIEQILTSKQISWCFWSSNRHLLRCLYVVSSEPFFEIVFKSALEEIMGNPVSMEVCYRTLHDFFPRNTPKEAIAVARRHSKLQDFVAQACEPGLNDLQGSLFLALYRLGALTDGTIDKIVSNLVTSLSDIDDMEHLPATLTFFFNADDSTLKALAASGNGEQLLPNLLRLEQHQDEGIAQKAAAIYSRSFAAGGQALTDARFGVVLQNLQSVSRTSLPMDALHELTGRLLGPDRKLPASSEMLPSLKLWTSALIATVRAPSPSLALLSPLGGAVNLVHTGSTENRSAVHSDAEGLSQALRIAMYVSRLIAETDLKEQLRDLGSDYWTVISLLYLTALLAEDNLSVLGTNGLWNPNKNQDAEAAVLDFVSETNAVLNDIWQRTSPELQAVEEQTAAPVSDYSRQFAALDQLRQDQSNGSAVHYYVALASAKVNTNLFELHGHNAEQAKASESLLKKARTSKDPLFIAATIVGLQHPLAGTQSLSRYCNELVADLTALDMSDPQHEQKAFEQLVLLNNILQTQEEAVGTIAKQRLIFVVKRLVPALNAGITLAITAEICKALAALLPGVQDMYGEHWAQVLAYLISFWTSVESQAGGPTAKEGRILITHASLKLYDTLRKLAKAEEANDDLVDALKEDSERIYDGLVLLLKSANGVSDETHQPLMVTHELLARQIFQMPQKPVQDADELYPLLYTPSRAIQQAAFDLLHKHIPATQEQLSLEVALDNKTAQLPEEVLSLILEAPTLDSLMDASFDRSMPLQLQGYLYSWRLLFAHFDGSSYRVKSDYIEQLKDGSYLSGLLNFTFDFLGHSRGKPVDASKFDIQEYTPDVEPSPERDVQWLLTHLYYLALTHLPSLVKSYYLDIRSRQTSLAVESWTAKYLSPLIISTSLQAVAEWSEKSVKEDPEYEKMSVKVGTKSKEIYVSYVVDEQTMAIKVVLPEAYPLASAQVVGVSRVAVKEEKWQSWLRNCQGVITFSNGSITDGLSAWRKNVTGALKGQTECAVCYSIIDSQKQLPTKRCPTCKHLYHSSCLFKWFKTSNASTCPLCRNTFNFN
ncbi:hypothetical protein LTR36_003624 [Oleoguttula mirabilis]|uniref:E3 ubiquitin-protein ligase listerin n=1 Tax=Oleoguttula mirabilis TaxID=1507867 RepID=A0AAV9JIZ3_9PEZI|nr:hypothetical protein LTR36_003624 [Oleoguttula mirabilis]